ncbi:MAG: nitroreductase family protein [Chitinispirillales bacterium]|nr:nitroreductase family protein [Chitinispirillales bacterium]
MMNRITMPEALKRTSPHPVSLICAQTSAGATNLAAVSWWTYLENDPPMIGFSLWKESYTCELVAGSGKAVLSIPGEVLADITLKCGNVSGRDVDKVKEFGIDLVDAPVKFPAHSRLAFACTLENKVEVGDCVFFICKVDDIFFNGDERQLFAWDGSGDVAPLKNYIKSRRSIRHYDPAKPVGRAELDQLLEAAMYAPSACNSRPWEFIAVTKREILDDIARTHPFAGMCATAAAAIIVVAIPQEGRPEGYFPQDCGAATQNILLQAASMGLGTCWCGVYPRDERIAHIRELFNIPQPKIPFNVIAIGFPDEAPGARGGFEAEKVSYVE